MGSWYNLEGITLTACINNKCGEKPVKPTNGIIDYGAYQAKLSEWKTCVSACSNARLSVGNTRETLPTSTNTQTTVKDSNDKGDPIFAQGYENGTKPVDQVNGTPRMSTGVKIGIGVGALALLFIGCKMFLAKKKSA